MCLLMEVRTYGVLERFGALHSSCLRKAYPPSPRRLHDPVERYELRHHDPCCHQSISFTSTPRLQTPADSRASPFTNPCCPGPIERKFSCRVVADRPA